MRAGELAPFTEIDLPLPDRRDGKVRASWRCGEGRRLIVTTDRLSAFDRVLAGVPYKGQVLNQLSAWWFERTADIVPNHVISVPDPNALLAVEARPLPVEVVVRGHITGVTDTSLWGMYAEGAREMYGYAFPDGLRKNTALPAAIVTPTTKATAGGHDEPLSCADVVARGLLPAGLWDRVVAAALAVFARGVELGAAAGLILADTKYELGLAGAGAGAGAGNGDGDGDGDGDGNGDDDDGDGDGELILIDEVHTPDSSRWWVAASYEERLAAGEEPESLDKEVVRRAFADAGYRGDGPVPAVPAEVWTQTTARYVDAYERLTGTAFAPGSYPVAERLADNLRKAGLL